MCPPLPRSPHPLSPSSHLGAAPPPLATGPFTWARGLGPLDPPAAAALSSCQARVRSLLRGQVFATLDGWRVKAVSAGRLPEACLLHAHLAYLYKAVTAAELDARSALTLLSANIFLQVGKAAGGRVAAEGVCGCGR